MMVHLILCFLLVLILIFIKISKLKRKTTHPPGPPGLPLLGNLHQFKANNTHFYLWRLSQQYGPIMSLKLGSVPTLVISSANMAKEVMKTHDDIFASRPKLVAQQKLSYDGLDIAFCPLNNYHNEIKKICIQHLFSSKHVQSFLPVREDEVSRLVKQIFGSAFSGEVINLSRNVIFFSRRFICRVAFGKLFDEGDPEMRRFNDILHESEALLGGFYFSDYFPSVGWIYDKLFGMNSRLEKNFKVLDSFYQELIQDHLISSQNKTKSMGQDILDILLQLQQGKSSSVELTLEHIKALLMNILLAGSDAPAALVTWTMTLLLKNPLELKRVQSEIRGLFQNKGHIDEVLFQELPYFKAIIKETLRLYPPDPLLVLRETVGSCTLDRYTIEPKTLVFVNAWAIGRDPNHWKDPNEFFPGRFLGNAIDFRGQDFGLIPFGSGRRICPGISLGMATVEYVLVNLLYSFDWELPDGTKIEDIDMESLPGVVMHKKNPLCLIAKIYK